MTLQQRVASRLINLLPYAIIMGVAFFMLHEIFAPGMLTKSDNALHAVEASYLAEHILPEHRWISGLYPYENAGMPLLLYFYQIGTWLIAALNLIFHIPIEQGYKLVLLFAYTFPACTLFFFLKGKFGSKSAFFPALAYLFQPENTRMFLAGMWNNGIGLGFLLISWYFLEKYNANMNLRRATVIGVLFSVTILAHYFVAIALIVLIAIYWLRELLKLRLTAMAYYLYLGLLGVLINLFYIYPFWEARNWLATGLGWGVGTNFREMAYKTIGIFLSLKTNATFLQPLTAGDHLLAIKLFFEGILRNLPFLAIIILAFIGLLILFRRDNSETALSSPPRPKGWGIKNFAQNAVSEECQNQADEIRWIQRKSKRFSLGLPEGRGFRLSRFYHKKDKFLFLTFIYALILIILGTGFWFLIPALRDISFINGLLSYRFLYYARTCLIIFAAYAIKNRLCLRRQASIKAKITAVFITLFVILLVSGIFLPAKSYTELSTESPLARELDVVGSWLISNVNKEQARIVYQNFFDNIGPPAITGDSAYGVMLGYKYKLYVLGAWATTPPPIEKYTIMDNHKLFGEDINILSDDELFKRARAFNVKYFIAIEPKLKERLIRSGLFDLEKEFTYHAIFSLRAYEPSWAEYEKPIEYNVVAMGDQNIVLHIRNNYANNKLLLKFAYHPYWRAHIAEEEIPLESGAYGLMGLTIPEGDYNLQLEYKPVKILPILVSLFMLIFALIILALKPCND